MLPSDVEDGGRTRPSVSGSNEKLRTFDERVTDLINAERNFRDNKKFNSLIRQAHLKYSQADFDDSIYEPDRKLDFSTIERLEDCAWIDEKHNLLITGPSGAGKTYLGCAFGVAACHQFHKVRYYPVNRILVELKKAYADGNDAYPWPSQTSSPITIC